MLNKILYTIIGLSLGFVFLPHQPKDYKKIYKPQVLGTNISSEVQILKAAPELSITKAPPELSAKAAFAYDLNSKDILYTLNFDQKLPIASLTKLTTALVVRKNVSAEKVVTVRSSELSVLGSKMGLMKQEKITVLNLLRGMLVPSSNDAALALTDFVSGSEENFVGLMNNYIEELGLKSTHFANATGLDNSESYSTPADLAVIVDQVLKDSLLSEIVRIKEMEVTSVDGKIFHNLRSTNKLLLEDPTILGIKTGFTDQAKGNLILRAKRGEAEVISIVLGSDNREEDSKRLLDWIFTVYQW